MTTRRLTYAVMTFSILSVAAFSGCGGSGSGLKETPVVENPAPPEGFKAQQEAIGGNMMNPGSTAAPAPAAAAP